MQTNRKQQRYSHFIVHDITVILNGHQLTSVSNPNNSRKESLYLSEDKRRPENDNKIIKKKIINTYVNCGLVKNESHLKINVTFISLPNQKGERNDKDEKNKKDG